MANILPTPINPLLSTTDNIVLDVLLQDITNYNDKQDGSSDSSNKSTGKRRVKSTKNNKVNTTPDASAIKKLRAMNAPIGDAFTPAVTTNFPISPASLRNYWWSAYINWARGVARVETDVVFVTHLIFYFLVSLPSALILYYHFTWIHGIAHVAMQFWSLGAYHSLVHQYIHTNGILNPKYAWFDSLFIYVTDPLFGHTWNSFYYHHVKHHHVENNGPDDLTSTLRYQRDDPIHFLRYLCKFLFQTWYQLPQYFIMKNRRDFAKKFIFWETSSYAVIFTLAYLAFKPTLFVFILPNCILRPVLMIGNFGQHAFVDEVDPDSEYRSSVTTFDVLNNQFAFNEGYHTSHHLNPRRHWRDHPIEFLNHKDLYAKHGALIFQDIDYLFITFKLICKDYNYLAKRLVPVGSQIGMSIPELEESLRSKTKIFSEEEILRHYPKKLGKSHH